MPKFVRARLVPCICRGLAPGMQFSIVWMPAWGSRPSPRHATCSPKLSRDESERSAARKIGSPDADGRWGERVRKARVTATPFAPSFHVIILTVASPLPILSLALALCLSALSSLASSSSSSCSSRSYWC